MFDNTGLRRLIEVSAGRKKADLVIKNAHVVDVFNHSIIDGTVAVCDGVIAGIGAYEGEQELDMHGKYLLPGLIDSHVHIESAMTSPEQFASAVVPRGTTTVIADPHEISNVCGLEGIQYMLDATELLDLQVYFMLPSCVPATEFENSGAKLGVGQLYELMSSPRVLGLGEMMDYPNAIQASEHILDKIALAASCGKRIDGHAPMVEGRELNAYAASGISTDHECSTVDEMHDRLSRGMYVLMREGSAARNLRDLLKGVSPENSRRCLFCTDDRQPEDILKSGHIDNHLRIAVSMGIDPLTAVSMATINAAECYGLSGTGALAPGYAADMIVVDDLKSFNVQKVFIGGKAVAQDGSMLQQPRIYRSEAVENTVHVEGFNKDSLKLTLATDLARVIRIAPHSLVTEQVIRKVDIDENREFIFHEDLDLLKLAVVERHNLTGNIGLGLVENYRLKGGAIATTIAHDSHNIIAIGDDDADMCAAIEHLIELGGGIAIAAQGKILDSLALPIAGLMSKESAEHVNERLQRMHSIAFEKLHVYEEIDPFMTLSFLALPVIPDLKLTDMGLFDVREFRFTDISVR